MINFDCCKECGSPSKCLRLKECQLGMTNDNEPARNQCYICNFEEKPCNRWCGATACLSMDSPGAHLYNEPAPQAGQIARTASSQEDHAAGPADAGSPDLVERLKVKHTHYNCEDCWYSCAILTCDDRRKSDECDCGADRENALRAEAASHILALESRLKEAEERAKANQEDAERWKALKELAGYWQDGSQQVVLLDQDDATRTAFIRVGSKDNAKRYYVEGCGFNAAIDAARGGKP